MLALEGLTSDGRPCTTSRSTCGPGDRRRRRSGRLAASRELAQRASACSRSRRPVTLDGKDVTGTPRGDARPRASSTCRRTARQRGCISPRGARRTSRCPCSAEATFRTGSVLTVAAAKAAAFDLRDRGARLTPNQPRARSVSCRAATSRRCCSARGSRASATLHLRRADRRRRHGNKVEIYGFIEERCERGAAVARSLQISLRSCTWRTAPTLSIAAISRRP